mgnify:CR=1 FL=1
MLFRSRVFFGMFVESLVYAAVLGHVVALLTHWLLTGTLFTVGQQDSVGQLSLTTQLVVSLGAGIYEELLFRVLLVGGLAWVGLRMGWRRPVAFGTAVVASAVIFSAFHYVGPLGDPFALPSFTFRAMAGLLLAGGALTQAMNLGFFIVTSFIAQPPKLDAREMEEVDDADEERAAREQGVHRSHCTGGIGRGGSGG